MKTTLRHMFLVFCALAFAGVQTACACAHEHSAPVTQTIVMPAGHDHCADMSGESADHGRSEVWKVCDHGASLKADLAQVNPFTVTAPMPVVVSRAYSVIPPVIAPGRMASWPAAVDPPPLTPMQAKTRFLN
jgi:hypothetical protein